MTKQTGKSGIFAELHVSHDSYDIPTHCFLPMIQAPVQDDRTHEGCAHSSCHMQALTWNYVDKHRRCHERECSLTSIGEYRTDYCLPVGVSLKSLSVVKCVLRM